MAKTRRLIYDIPNLTFRTAAAQKAKLGKNATPEDIVGLTMHSTLMSVNKYFKKFQPDQVAFVFEGRNNWRKPYARNHKDVILEYKGDRVRDPEMAHFFEVINAFKEVVENHTSIICISSEGLEGDDCVAGYVQKFVDDPDEEIIIVSGDKDFIQLLRSKHNNVRLINPDTAKDRNLPGDKLYYEDLDYFIFEKCIRAGDDNVHSAYPRVRTTRIKKAYEDEVERVNFMNETWSKKNADGTEQVFRVGDIFKANQVLMDLTAQPPEIRELIKQTVDNAIANPGKFSNFQVLKFFGQYSLKQITDQMEQFVLLFTVNTNNNYFKKIRETEEKEDTRNGLLRY